MFTHGTASYFLFEFGELKLVIVYYLLDMYSMVQRLFQTDSTFELGIVSQSHSPGLCYMLLLFFFFRFRELHITSHSHPLFCVVVFCRFHELHITSHSHPLFYELFCRFGSFTSPLTITLCSLCLQSQGVSHHLSQSSSVLCVFFCRFRELHITSHNHPLFYVFVDSGSSTSCHITANPDPQYVSAYRMHYRPGRGCFSNNSSPSYQLVHVINLKLEDKDDGASRRPVSLKIEPKDFSTTGQCWRVHVHSVAVVVVLGQLEG